MHVFTIMTSLAACALGMIRAAFCQKPRPFKRVFIIAWCRDLKPENVLLSMEGDVKLSDFGLGYLPSSSLHNNVLQTTCGTPNYVAPEVLMRQGYYGAPADVWSLGEHACMHA